MATVSESALPKPMRASGAIKRLPIAHDDRHLLRREAFLLLFCAAFASAVFLAWSVAEATLQPRVDGETLRALGRLKDIFAPFLTAYVAARLYATTVRRYGREIQHQRSLLEHIIAFSADGVVTLDADDCITTWNPGAQHIFGYIEAEIIGEHASVLYPPEADGHTELATLRHAVEDQGALRNHLGDRVRKDGRVIRTEVSTMVLRDENGGYAGRASIFRDITERDRILEELAQQRSLAAVGEMAAAVAHEIKNPLAGIGGAVRVIGRAFPADDPRAEVVEEIQYQVRRLDETIRDLLTFARPIEPRFADFDLREFVDRILRVLGEEPVLKEQRLIVDVADGLVVRADPQLLENSLVNLLLNAGQAVQGREGAIVIHASAADGETRIAIADDGPGIPDEVKEKLFKPFFTTRAKGTGLGLTIVRKFIEVMGGHVDFETVEGEGTTFSITLLEAPKS